jgi:phosphocarrier protein HPr
MMFGHKQAPVSAQREVRITNKLGLHARPAAHFVKHVRTFRSEIWFVTKAGRYSASSLIDVLRANLDCGAAATLEAHGADAEEAVERLQKLLNELDRFDES